MFAHIRAFVDLRQQMLADVALGPNGYPVSPLTDCVAPVAPEDWLATYTNTIEQADAMNANGLTNNIPSWADSTPPGNNAWRMCKKGY